MQQSQLELNFLVPTVGIDGNVVFISDKGDKPTIHFFQARKQVGDQLLADVVASVTFDSIEVLEQLGATIDETIRNHQAREA